MKSWKGQSYIHLLWYVLRTRHSKITSMIFWHQEILLCKDDNNPWTFQVGGVLTVMYPYLQDQAWKVLVEVACSRMNVLYPVILPLHFRTTCIKSRRPWHVYYSVVLVHGVHAVHPMGTHQGLAGLPIARCRICVFRCRGHAWTPCCILDVQIVLKIWTLWLLNLDVEGVQKPQKTDDPYIGGSFIIAKNEINFGLLRLRSWHTCLVPPSPIEKGFSESWLTYQIEHHQIEMAWSNHKDTRNLLAPGVSKT